MLTDEQKKQLGDEAKAVVSEAFNAAVAEKSKEIPKRFSPAEDTKVEIVNNPEDKLMADKRGGFKSFGHFLRDVYKVETDKGSPPETLRRWSDACKKTAGYMEESDLAQGGYTVPVQFGQTIFQQSLESSIVRPRARFQPMTSNRIEIGADVDATHQGSFFGGVVIYRGSEGGQYTASNPTYQKIALTLHKVTGLCNVTDELIEDSTIAVEADVTRKFAQSIGFTEDDDFLNGTGANQPLGALNSANPAIITVTAVSGQGASTVIAENIRDMWARMYPVGQSRAIWLANNDVFPQLFGMSLAIGTAGVPIWLPAGGVSGAPYSTLMGRPLILTEKCQTLGTAGDIALVDLSAYVVAGKANGEAPTVATSMHFKFDYAMQSFRYTIRYDGQPLWTSALTPKYSSSTLSPFVVLSGTRT